MRTLVEIRRDMVIARNANDEEWAKELSQERERVKMALRQSRECFCGCGRIIRGISTLHQVCYIRRRFYEKTLGPIHT